MVQTSITHKCSVNLRLPMPSLPIITDVVS